MFKRFVTEAQQYHEWRVGAVTAAMMAYAEQAKVSPEQLATDKVAHQLLVLGFLSDLRAYCDQHGLDYDTLRLAAADIEDDELADDSSRN